MTIIDENEQRLDKLGNSIGKRSLNRFRNYMQKYLPTEEIDEELEALERKPFS